MLSLKKNKCRYKGVWSISRAKIKNGMLPVLANTQCEYMTCKWSPKFFSHVLLKVKCLMGAGYYSWNALPPGGGGVVGDDCTWNWLNIKGMFIWDMFWVFPNSEYLEKLVRPRFFYFCHLNIFWYSTSDTTVFSVYFFIRIHRVCPKKLTLKQSPWQSTYLYVCSVFYFFCCDVKKPFLDFGKISNQNFCQSSFTCSWNSSLYFFGGLQCSTCLIIFKMPDCANSLKFAQPWCLWREMTQIACLQKT